MPSKQKSFIRSIVFSKLMILLAIAIVAGLVAVVALRSNYSTMTQLRQAVAVADEQNGDVEAALQQLREHVHGHMNTNLASGANPIKPPIQLKARYERLVAAEKERVQKINADVTARGEAICGAQFPGAGFNSARVSCVTDYVSQNAAKEMTVPESLYKFDFISPRWSPDVAGLAIVMAVMALLGFMAGLVVKLLQRHHS